MPLRLLELHRLLRAVMIVVLLAYANVTQAQVTSGTVGGVVKDQAGAVIPGATITITDPKTKNSNRRQSDQHGGPG